MVTIARNTSSPSVNTKMYIAYYCDYDDDEKTFGRRLHVVIVFDPAGFQRKNVVLFLPKDTYNHANMSLQWISLYTPLL